MYIDNGFLPVAGLVFTLSGLALDGRKQIDGNERR